MSVVGVWRNGRAGVVRRASAASFAKSQARRDHYRTGAAADHRTFGDSLRRRAELGRRSCRPVGIHPPRGPRRPDSVEWLRRSPMNPLWQKRNSEPCFRRRFEMGLEDAFLGAKRCGKDPARLREYRVSSILLPFPGTIARAPRCFSTSFLTPIPKPRAWPSITGGRIRFLMISRLCLPHAFVGVTGRFRRLGGPTRAFGCRRRRSQACFGRQGRRLSADRG